MICLEFVKLFICIEWRKCFKRKNNFIFCLFSRIKFWKCFFKTVCELYHVFFERGICLVFVKGTLSQLSVEFSHFIMFKSLNNFALFYVQNLLHKLACLLYNCERKKLVNVVVSSQCHIFYVCACILQCLNLFILIFSQPVKLIPT